MHRAFRMMQKALALLAVVCLLAACQGKASERQVVVYTSVDQVYAEPVLNAFEERSGIRVLAVYDVEATKTVGLAQRLVAENSNPQAAVFWSGEFLQTMFLKEQGVLTPAHIPEGANLPPEYVDPQGYWAAFGGRARVIILNTGRVAPDEAPASLYDLLSDTYPASELALANPLFGTTSTQAAALYAEEGEETARTFFEQVSERGVQVLDGNSVVRDQVAGGQLSWGLTDTDDACGAIQKGAPVQVIFPDQGAGEMGTLVIPNTVAMIAGGPHPEEGQALVDYLLSPETEARLVQMDWIQIPTRPLPEGITPACFAGVEVQGMRVGFEEIYQNLATATEDMQEIFVR